MSDQGVVRQRILEWEPERRLSFRMEQTNLSFQRHVREIVDTFDLVPTRAGVQVTRTTRVGLKGRYQFGQKILFWLSLKKVHRYVFRNWQRLASPGTPVPGRLGASFRSPPEI